MEGKGWKVRELNAFDLLPETNLINVFVTSAKLADISEEYQEFKSLRSKSPQRVRYKYHPPLALDKKVVKYEGPRLNKELPKIVKVNLLRNRTNCKSINDNPKAELFIEDLIRNRQQITLPRFEKPKNHYSNLKEQFIKTRSQLLDERKEKCDTLLQSIKENMKNQSYRVESEMRHWDYQPLRKWDHRSDRMLVQKKFQNVNRSVSIPQNEENYEEENKKTSDFIGNILEACGDDILNWPS